MNGWAHFQKTYFTSSPHTGHKKQKKKNTTLLSKTKNTCHFNLANKSQNSKISAEKIFKLKGRKGLLVCFIPFGEDYLMQS